MQHCRGRMQGDRLVGLDSGIVPADALGVFDHRHMIREQCPEAGIFQQRGPLRCRHRSGVWNMCKAEV
jgi:hypothetical protein